MQDIFSQFTYIVFLLTLYKELRSWYFELKIISLIMILFMCSGKPIT
jgi:hypothetical protein